MKEWKKRNGQHRRFSISGFNETYSGGGDGTESTFNETASQLYTAYCFVNSSKNTIL